MTTVLVRVAAAVIMHQLAAFMDGRRIAAFFDECRFYMQPLKRSD